MSEDDEQPMEASAGSQDESKQKPSAEVLEGKRAKKRVERLDFQAPKQMEKLKIGDGSGEKLGDIPRTNFHINRMKPADLKPLHSILFDRPGKIATIKKNLRLFNGFSFDGDSKEFTKKREKLLKSSTFTNTKLKAMCSVLDLEKKGTHSDLVDRILTFLLSPKNSGKRLPVKKKRKSKKKLSGDDSTLRSKKVKSSSSSASPKKSKSSSKSKAIVMDSSSDEEEEEEEEEEEKVGASVGATRRTDQSESEEEEIESRGTHRKPTKKRVRKDTSEDESSEDQEPKNKKSAPNKPGARSKKADSSSNKNTHTAEDSSDEDEPLIRMVRKSPSDDQLKETVQVLLKEADLEQITMKNIFQQVFDTYPDHDLTSKKDFIRQAVRSIIT